MLSDISVNLSASRVDFPFFGGTAVLLEVET